MEEENPTEILGVFVDMTCRRILILLLAAGTVLLLSGCRARTNGRGPESPIAGTAAGGGNADGQGETASGSAADAEAQESEEADPREEASAGSRSRENPEATRKEYDENAPAEIVTGTERLVHGGGEGSGAPVPAEDAGEKAAQLNHLAEEPATRTVAAEEAEQ